MPRNIRQICKIRGSQIITHRKIRQIPKIRSFNNPLKPLSLPRHA